MAPWSSLVVLSTLVVITLSFPSPDGEYQIPEVGTGRRSQYYILHDDGTYKYGYDSGDGAFESSKLHAVGNLEGRFGYTDPEGNQIQLEYESGSQGFIARGGHLPQLHPDHAAATATLRAAQTSEPFVDPLASEDLDPSYNFQFDSEDQARSETSNTDGIVTGSYSYVGDDGVKRSYTYRAGEGIGFVIEGDDIPQDVNTASATQQLSHGSRHTAQHATRNQVIGQSQIRQRPVVKSSLTPHQSSNINQERSDASYSFSYSTDDHSRSETSDSDLNVKGKFSFIADDGVERTLEYIAGTGTGFQATGDHIPKQEDDFGARLSTQAQSGHQQQSFRQQSFAQVTGANAQRVTQNHAQSHKFRQSNDLLETNINTIEYTPANIQSSVSDDGSYSFSYNNPEHSRSESGNAGGVSGTFEFTSDDDGVSRHITYEAGENTGFVVDGAHIPVGPIVPGASSGRPTGRIEPVEEIEFVDPLADTGSDASYAFNFDSDLYSRTETSDADGNVAGTYSVVGEDGIKRTYRFRAGKGIGFETELVGESQSSGVSTGTASSSTAAHASSFKQSTLSNQASFKQASLSSGFGSSRAHVSAPLPATRQTSFKPLLKTGQKKVTLKSGDDDSDFELHQYSASDNNGKFGYVIKYNK